MNGTARDELLALVYGFSEAECQQALEALEEAGVSTWGAV